MHSPVSGHLSGFPDFATMYGAAINTLLNVFWCMRASFSRGLNLGVGLAAQSLHTFPFTSAARLLCRTALAIYSPTSNVLTHLTPHSCQLVGLWDFKCLSFGWVCKIFILIRVSPLTTMKLRGFSHALV